MNPRAVPSFLTGSSKLATPAGNAEHLEKFIVKSLRLTLLVVRVFPLIGELSRAGAYFVWGQAQGICSLIVEFKCQKWSEKASLRRKQNAVAPFNVIGTRFDAPGFVNH
jgi:hypothetical protein